VILSGNMNEIPHSELAYPMHLPVNTNNLIIFQTGKREWNLNSYTVKSSMVTRLF